jgi:outer membrane lipoprotein-sorting protein
MEMGGQVMKVPMPVDKMTAQYRDEAFLEELQAGMVVEDLGTESLDGEAMRKIRFVQEAEEADSIAWISTKTGFVHQIDVTSGKGGKKSRARVRYSDFNDPAIVIEAPR